MAEKYSINSEICIYSEQNPFRESLFDLLVELAEPDEMLEKPTQ